MHLVYSHVSRDFARFLVFNLGTLVENLLVCYVLYSSHVGSKTVKYFSVYLPSITVFMSESLNHSLANSFKTTESFMNKTAHILYG